MMSFFAARPPNSTRNIMQQVLLATMPGILALTVFFGIGTLLNIVCAALTAIVCEAAILRLRKRPVRHSLRNDSSALVSAVLLGIALPPDVPFWLIVSGTAFAIIIVKHLYGGLGQNLFNPAMAAYAMLLVSFPLPMTQWTAPGFSPVTQTLQYKLGMAAPTDATTMATPLDVVKHNNSLLMDQLWQSGSPFGSFAGIGWEWVNIAFLLGGLYLLHKRLFHWHAPLGLLAALGVCALLFYDGGSSASGGSPLFHWFSGGTMLLAWFIITDPVTGASSNKGRLIAGILAGILIYLIRYQGHYPDGSAFAILLMNCAVPWIDRITQTLSRKDNKA